MKTKIYLTLSIAILIFNQSAIAQTPTVQDCLGAIPITSSVYYESNAYSGTGNIPYEINDLISCLQSGEKNDVWYRFTAIAGGTFGFDLTPNVMTDDYDWAVFDITGTICDSIATNPMLEVSCNYSGAPGVTGPNGTAPPNCEPLIQIYAGHTYVINVSQFSITPNGYTISFINPQLMFLGSLFSGEVYMDTDSDCIKSPVDYSTQKGIVSVNSGMFYIIPDTAGMYSAYVDTGTYTLDIIPIKYCVKGCPLTIPNYTINFPSFGLTSPNNDFALKPTTGINDLSIDITIAACDSIPNKNVNIFYKNNGTSTLSGTVKLIYDTSLFFNNSSILPDSIYANSLVWNYYNLQPNQYGIITCNFANLDSTVIFKNLTALIDPIIFDTVPNDNQNSRNFLFCYPYDPNEKSVEPTGIGSAGLIDTTQTLTYTVRFQNTGTAPAINVLIKDTLDADLDPPTLQIISFSHPCNYFMTNRNLEFHFNGINLPDSNANEPASHGFVKYSVKQKPNLADGTEIKNYASIFFDNNAPIATNTVLNTISYTLLGIDANADAAVPLTIYPNPSNGNFNIAFNKNETFSGNFIIYDATGRTIKKLVIESKQSITISAGNILNGIYFYQLINQKGSLIKTGKLIIQK